MIWQLRRWRCGRVLLEVVSSRGDRGSSICYGIIVTCIIHGSHFRNGMQVMRALTELRVGVHANAKLEAALVMCE